MNLLKTFVLTRRRLLTSLAALVSTTAIGIGKLDKLFASSKARAAQPAVAGQGATVITKSICHQCPGRCGIDVYTTDGRVHAIYGSLNNPISMGKLCPKGYLGTYILYDPDRFKGPMKRTNPNKGRNEDPNFVPITWDEALDTIAARLQSLRDKGESHRFAIIYGRGWGESDAGLQKPFGKLYGSPNVAINHSSMCADAGKKVKLCTDGNYSYSAYDYANTNYLLNFGAGFLEAFRPFTGNLRMWGYMRTKSPRTQVTVVDVHLNTTAAAADRALLIKPGTDGALALAIAHVMLTEGLWDKEFVGDFTDGVNRFHRGEPVDPATFRENWVHGLVEWWNEEVKDRSPAWASEITTLLEDEIIAVAREFGTTRPAVALFERGPTAHTNGVYNGMAIHALNALAGSLFAEGGLFYQMKPSYGELPVNFEDFMDDYAKSADRKKYPRVDLVGTDAWPMASNMLQEVAKNHLAGKPYKLDTVMFYLTNSTWTSPEPQVWEEALKDVFVIDTSPFPGETAMLADLVVPDHTYLERLQDTPTYPFQGWPMTGLRQPAVKPLYDTKAYGDTLIEIGKRMKGPMGEYYKALKDTENVLRHLAKGFEQDPGDNGVNGFESWKEKGVWFKKPYHWRQHRGNFYEWDGTGYSKLMAPLEVKDKLLKTPSGKFEVKSGYLEEHAAYVSAKLDIPEQRVGFPQWVAPRHTGGGDLHLVTPKLALHAEGRGANLPHTIAHLQPTLGGNTTAYLEIHPSTARERDIRNNSKVRITSSVGTIEAYARYYEGIRPDTVVLPMEHGHWAMGRWARNRTPGHSGLVTPNVSEPISGLACYYTAKVTVAPA